MARDIYDLLEKDYGVRVEALFNPELAQLTATDAIMLRQDPRVVAWTLCNLGAATIYDRPMGVASATAGFAIAPNAIQSLVWRDDGILPALEWHAVSPGGAQAYLLVCLRIVDGDE